MGTRTGLIARLLSPWKARIAVGFPLLLTVYQFGCDQFGLPTLPRLWGLTGSGVPWWGWLVIAQSGFVYALFEYIRLNLVSGSKNNDASGQNASLEERFSNISSKIDEGLVNLRTETSGEMNRVQDTLKEIRSQLATTIELSGKVEDIRVDTAINAKEVEKIQHERAGDKNIFLGSLHAIGARESLSKLQDAIRFDAALLYDDLLGGTKFDEHDWLEWEKIHTRWDAALKEWLDLGQWYAIAVRERVTSIDDAKYAAEWSVKDSQFPNAEAVRRFKKFRIIYTQWESVVPGVWMGVGNVAFSGLTDYEVRSGRPVG